MKKGLTLKDPAQPMVNLDLCYDSHSLLQTASALHEQNKQNIFRMWSQAKSTCVAGMKVDLSVYRELNGTLAAGSPARHTHMFTAVNKWSRHPGDAKQKCWNISPAVRILLHIFFQSDGICQGNQYGYRSVGLNAEFYISIHGLPHTQKDCV